MYLVQLLQLLQTDSLACIRVTPEMWACTYICTSPSHVTSKAVVYNPFMTLLQIRSHMTWHCSVHALFVPVCSDEEAEMLIETESSSLPVNAALPLGEEAGAHVITCMLTTGQHLHKQWCVLLVYMPKSMGLQCFTENVRLAICLEAA